MAVLKKDEFFEALHNKFGTDTSEETIGFIENMTDTYNDLEQRANGDGIDWEKKAKEIDEAWRAKYRHRFFSGCDGGYPNEREDTMNNKSSEDIRVEDLFE